MKRFFVILILFTCFVFNGLSHEVSLGTFNFLNPNNLRPLSGTIGVQPRNAFALLREESLEPVVGFNVQNNPIYFSGNSLEPLRIILEKAIEWYNIALQNNVESLQRQISEIGDYREFEGLTRNIIGMLEPLICIGIFVIRDFQPYLVILCQTTDQANSRTMYGQMYGRQIVISGSELNFFQQALTVENISEKLSQFRNTDDLFN